MSLAELENLLAALDDPDHKVRLVAVMQAADLAEDDAEPFVRASRDIDAGVRLEAVRAMEGNSQETAIEALADRLADGEAEVAEAAALSLAEILDDGAAPVLLRRLARAEGPAKAALLAALRKLRHLGSLSPALSALTDPLPQVRREAVGVLAYLRHPDAISALDALAVGDADAAVRLAAVGALLFAEEGSLLTGVLAALRDADWQVREAAALTLARLRPAQAVPEVIAALDDSHWQVRLKAAQALASLRDPRAVTPLVAQLGHPIPNLRKETAATLGAIGDTAAIPALTALLDDSDVEVRKSAARALEALGKVP